MYSAGMKHPQGELVEDFARQTDPCLLQGGSILRFTVLALLWFTMLGTIVLLILLPDQSYGIQLSSIVGYTAAVALYTFSRNRNNMQPFLLSCPVVHRQIPLLVRRHITFLAAFFILQTTALNVRQYLPDHLTAPRRSGASPFAMILGVLCGCLAIVQILSNRAFLERAHLSAQAEFVTLAPSRHSRVPPNRP